MRGVLLSSLGLGLLLLAPSCVLTVSSASVQRSDGTGYAYSATRHGKDLDISISSLPDAERGPGIQSATARLFVDANENERLDEGELVEEWSTDLDEVARTVEWKNQPLSASVRDESELMIEFKVVGRDRSARRVIHIIGVFHD